MAKRKKKNNIVPIKGNLYYRLHWYNEYGRQVECKIPLITKKKDEAIRRGKKVAKHIDDIKDGTIQKFQFKEYFWWMNDKGTSTLKKLSIEDIMPQYLKYRHNVVEKSTAEREGYILKQFYRYFGKTKPVAEITYKDI